MPTPASTTNQQYDDTGKERERLRLRAVELSRQRLILENELASPGLSAEQAVFLRQRLDSLSTDEDRISAQLAQLERRLADIKKRREEETALRRTSAARRQTQVYRPASAPSAAGQLSVIYGRRQADRETRYAALGAQAKQAAMAVVITALIIAGLADILSLIDLGWLISWALPLVTWVIVRRIRAMDNSLDAVKSAHQDVITELRILRQRIGPSLSVSQSQAVMAATSFTVGNAAGSYVRTFVRDQIIAQLVELIPVIDILPLYLGSVVKTLIDQRTAYRRVQEAMIPYRAALDLLDRLEALDVEIKIVGAASVNPERPTQPAVVRPTPAPVRDINIPAAAPVPA